MPRILPKSVNWLTRNSCPSRRSSPFRVYKRVMSNVDEKITPLRAVRYRTSNSLHGMQASGCNGARAELHSKNRRISCLELIRPRVHHRLLLHRLSRRHRRTETTTCRRVYPLGSLIAISCRLSAISKEEGGS